MRDQNERPIFVIGFQRSGTTLLQSLVGSHQRIAAPPETYFLFRIARLASYYGDLHDDENLSRALHDALHPPAELFADAGFDEATLHKRLVAGPRSMRSILDVLMTDFAHRHGKTRWSEKTPGQHAAEVLGTFPDAQLVHIVRDPRDVIASSIQTPWTRPDAYTLALEWKAFFQITTRAGDRAGTDSFLQIRYEDLTRDPAGVMRTVFDFLGERFDPAIVSRTELRGTSIARSAGVWQSRALQDIVPAVEGAWRQRLKPRERRIIAALLADQISELGYEPVTTIDRRLGRLASLPKGARRRYRARRAKGSMRDPQAYYEATQRFLQEQAEKMSAS